MAVERLTDYTRRIWTALGPDAPAGHDIHVNDVIYYMDSSECCIVTNVYPDGSIDCETLPDVGGGGGGPVMGTVNPVSNKIIIPKVPDKQNFMFYVSDPDSNYFSAGGRVILGVHPSWYTNYNLYHMKNNQTALPPTTVTGGTRTASSSDDSSISYIYNNGNTVGSMPNGYTVIFLWW